MRIRLSVVVVTLVLVLGVSGTAYAFDCIRVSSSPQGLEQSSKSGNWLPFNLSSPAAVQRTFANTFGPITAQQAACFATKYAATGQPKYFALGVGVAGGKKESTNSQGARAGAGGFGVLAWHNKNYRILSDGKGIDHIDDSPILSAVFGSAAACGVPIGEA